MRLVNTPEDYDVAVTTNLFGDIVTDLGAMLQGGMGIAASANLNPGKVSLFEPIHGSFPQAAGSQTASPIAAILAGALMLDYVGEKEAAAAIEAITSLRMKIPFNFPRDPNRPRCAKA